MAVCYYLGVSALVVLLGLANAQQSVWLSDLDLSKAIQGWGKPGINRSVEGHPLELKDRVFEHGFGTHSPGRLVVQLDGKTSRFHAVVGIDDEVPTSRGSAEFLILSTSHRVLWRSGVLRRGDDPKTADVSLNGEREITLVVSDGGDGFEYDHADWADAQFSVDGRAPVVVEHKTTEPVIAPSQISKKPQIHGPQWLGAFTSTPFLWRVPVDGAGPFQFSSKSLPAGLRLDAGKGILSGSLRNASHYRTVITVKGAQGSSSSVIDIASGSRISPTPAMGWNSYDAYGDSVTEQEVLANAEVVAEKLQPFGWDTIVVDYRWYDPGAHNNDPNSRADAPLTIDKFGRLLPSLNRFPSALDGNGFKALADRFHKQGLKFGVHIMRGIPRIAVKLDLPIEGSKFRASEAANVKDNCGWCPDMYGVRGDTPAGQAYYDSIFRLYASWGLDFVKMDDASTPYHTDEIRAAHQAILASGRSIVLSLSPGETPTSSGDHAAENSNQWRVSGDFWDNWGSLDHEFTLAERWQKWVGPGHWPDADMLPVGHLSVENRSVDRERFTRFTRAEQTTLIALWCLLPSPLMLGADVTKLDSWTLALLTNPEVLALNQDTVTHGAKLSFRKDGVDVWTRKLSDGSYALGIFNRGDYDIREPLDWRAFGVKPPVRLRDLWRRSDFRGNSILIPSHGVALFRSL